MSIKKTILQLANLLLMLFILFTVLPVKLNYSSIVIIILLLLSIFNLLVFRHDFEINKRLIIFILCIPFLIYSVGMINTINIDYGFNFLTKNLSFIAFPFIVYSLQNYIKLDKVYEIFLIGLTSVNLYLIYLFLYYFNFGTKFYMLVTTDIYHSTYLGLYNLFAYWICVLILAKKNKNLFRFFALFFLFCAIITSARIIFLLSILSLGGTIIFSVQSKTKRMVLLTLTILMAFLVIFKVPSIKQKFNQLIEIEKVGFDENNYQSISSRFGKIQATISVIKNNFWLGAGTGDLIDELVKEYENMNFVMGYKYRYNPHNQYLDNIARNGIIGGGICLITLFLWPIILALRRKNLIIGALILMVAGVCLTESVLNVHKGITFYAFFLTLLINHTLLSKNNILVGDND